MVASRLLLECHRMCLLNGHGGRPSAGQGVDQPGVSAPLARTGRVAVKLSGLRKFSTLAPHADARPFINALIEEFSLDNCLWATDWPFLKAPQRLDVGPLLRAVEQWLPRAQDRQRLFWDTPRRWLGFA